MRGEELAVMLVFGMPRITPACAGRREPRCQNCKTQTDHPRVCGEKLVTAWRTSRGIGSPPRVRGEDVRNADKSQGLGITPACAGRSLTQARRCATIEDHPRVCGEKAVVNPRFQSARGSPPRVRGEGEAAGLCIKYARITPACAGRSRWKRRGACQLGDHPRVCGEKADDAVPGHRRAGSPPRVRGEVRFH